MAQENELEIIKQRVIDYVKILVQTLESKNIDYFNGNPSVEIAHRGEYLMLSLIDDDLEEINVDFNQKPSNAKKHIFISKKRVIDPTLDSFIEPFSFTYLQVKAIKEEIKQNSAYELNISRVDTLIERECFAIAVVFIVSAFEVAIKDFFFRYSNIWFDRLINEIDDEIFDKYKVLISNPQQRGKYYFLKEMDNQEYGIPIGHFEKCMKWNNLLVRDHIFNVCKKFGILKEYKRQLKLNNLEEIESFEILNRILFENKNNNVINFQNLPRVKKLFAAFFGLDFSSLEREIQEFQNLFDKRHKIIHGYLEDDTIHQGHVERAKELLGRIRNYIINTLSRQEFEQRGNKNFDFSKTKLSDQF